MGLLIGLYFHVIIVFWARYCARQARDFRQKTTGASLPSHVSAVPLCWVPYSWLTLATGQTSHPNEAAGNNDSPPGGFRRHYAADGASPTNIRRGHAGDTTRAERIERVRRILPQEV